MDAAKIDTEYWMKVGYAALKEVQDDWQRKTRDTFSDRPVLYDQIMLRYGNDCFHVGKIMEGQYLKLLLDAKEILAVKDARIAELKHLYEQQLHTTRQQNTLIDRLMAEVRRRHTIANSPHTCTPSRCH